MTNESKSTVFAPTNESKNNITFLNEGQAGKGWQYNETGINYDSVLDSISKEPINYDSYGVLPVITNEAKYNV